MKQIPAIKAVMTPFPYCIGADRSIDDAVQMMHDHGIRHLPVTEGDRLVAVVSDREIRVALGPAFKAADARRLTVGELMDRAAYIVELTEPLDVVVLHMAERRLDCALVVKGDRLVGIFTMTDACRSLGGVLRSLFPRGGDDAA